MAINIEIDDKVLFDPGFAPYVLVFSTTYDYVNTEVRKFKNAIQRKSKYRAFENGLHKLCDNVISFYLGCILYGAYLRNEYKNASKEIADNYFLGIDYEECKKSDANIELMSLKKFIESNDKNPFASKKINPKFEKIVNDYIEFLEINKFFSTTKTTTDIKIPKSFQYIDEFNKEELNEIMDTISEAINSKKLEKLLLSKYLQ